MKYIDIFQAGYLELKNAILNPAQWLYLGRVDLSLRYRRSILGPFWVSISTGIMILVLSLLWSHIFNINIKDYMPFFAIGFVLWGWISAQLIDSAGGFFQSQGIIKQVKLPFAIFTLRQNTKQLINLFHNMAIVLLVLFIVGKGLFWISLIAIPGIILVQIIISLFSVIIAIFCTRYQDMAQVVSIATQIIFFFTPILWRTNSLKGSSYMFEFNPVYHWIEIIRAPLLGNPPTQSDILWTLGSILLLFGATTFLLGQYRSRIAYWL